MYGVDLLIHDFVIAVQQRILKTKSGSQNLSETELK